MNRRTIATKREDRGSALLIVLAFVLLLSIVTVAFLSKAMLARNVSNTSADQTRTEIFGQGALDAIVSDFQQEIAAGSTISTSTFNSSTSGTVTVAVYTPSTALAAVPSRTWTSGSVYVSATASTGAVNTGSDPLPNLIKRSACALAFYPASDTADYPNASSYPSSEKTFTSADANDSTSAASLNGRYFTSQRWNQSLLLPKASLTSTDPTPVSNFTVPDWILVQRDGSNPTAWSTTLCVTNPGDVTTANKNPVVGRYAYCIYNEGGLLDMNVAGFSSTTGSFTNLQYYKSSLANVDITQLATSAGSGTLVTTKQVDELVGWRNNATLQASGAMAGTYTYSTTAAANYFANVLGPGSGLMQTGNSSLSSGQSDHRFASRQQLIDVMLNGIASSSTDTATLQNALQYMGTFSRDINQPSYVPDSGRPHMKPGTAADPAKNGGNDAGTDDVSNYAAMGNLSWTGYVNVPFPATLVQTAYVRNDGSLANVGDPLVKRRFALNRLAWLTYMGPIADDAGNLNNSASSAGYVGGNAAAFTTIINTLEQTYGISASMLALGGPTNIKNYFGLQWQVDPTDGRYKWFYNVHNNSSGTAGKGIIRELGGPNAIAASGDTNPHDPDFFELLKATVLAGSKAKTLTYMGAPSPFPTVATDPYNPLIEQYNADVSLDLAVIQLGANIIDQFDADSYVTEIVFNNGTMVPTTNPSVMDDDNATGNKIIRGSESVPYLYRVVTGDMILRTPNVFAAPTGTKNLPAPGETTLNPLYSGFNNTGVGVMMEEPEVWNPYDYTETLTAPYPSKFRLVADSADPSSVANAVKSSYSSASTASYTPICIVATDYYAQKPLNQGYPPFGNSSFGASTGSGTPTFNYGPSAASGTMSFAASPQILTPANTEMDFNAPATGAASLLYREPTLLCAANLGVASGSMTPGANVTMGWTPSSTSILGQVLNTAGSNSYSSSAHALFPDTGTLNGIDISQPLSMAAPAGSNGYAGIVLGVYPVQWVIAATGTNCIYNSTLVSPSNVTINSGTYTGSAAYITYRLQYPDPNAADPANSWVTYDEKYTTSKADWCNGINGLLFNTLITEGSPAAIMNARQQSGCWQSFPDPRVSRFGTTNFQPGFTGGGSSGKNNYYSAPQLWLDKVNGVLPSDRPDYNFGYAMATTGSGTYAANFAPGWLVSTGTTTVWWGALSVNLIAPVSTAIRYSGDSVNTSSSAAPSGKAAYYSDADGVVRRATGAISPLNNAYGLPMAVAEPAYQSAVGANPSNMANYHYNRPHILNRPFRSVAELGYVFSGTPWKNLDFFNAESGDSALLDVFCVNDTDDPNALVAGKVDLNTHQIPVLADILAGAYFDDMNPGTNGYYIGSTKDLTNGTAAKYTNEPFTLACLLVEGPSPNNNTGTSGSSTMTPLRNLKELVGRWVGATPAQGFTPIDPTLSSNYQGFSSDLNSVFSQASGTVPSFLSGSDQRWREAAVRALSAVGETRVWNVMIDLVAQTGRYPSSATNAAQFMVEGERRYWVHLAIDRYTGQVLDRQIEEVKQ